MKKHTKVYLDYYGYAGEESVPCEICGGKAQDIHHINARGMGGSSQRDYIENLMALCRRHHDMAESEELAEKDLQAIHLAHMKARKRFVGNYVKPETPYVPKFVIKPNDN